MEIVQSLGYDTDEVLELVRLGVMRLPTRASPILTQADDEVAPPATRMSATEAPG